MDMNLFSENLLCKTQAGTVLFESPIYPKVFLPKNVNMIFINGKTPALNYWFYRQKCNYREKIQNTLVPLIP